MELRAYITILIRRKWIILLAVGVTCAAAVLVGSRMQPVYAATATVRVATGGTGTVDYASYVYAERLMNTYAKIITSAPVLEQVRERLALGVMPQVDVEVVRDTELIRITVSGPDAQVVPQVANALADVLKTQSQSLYSGGSKSATEMLDELIAQTELELADARTRRDALAQAPSPDLAQLAALSSTVQLKQQALALLLTQYEAAQYSEAVRANAVSIVEPARVPDGPTSPNLKLNALLGALVGLVVGLVIVVAAENMDSRLHSSEAVTTASNLPVLGRIPKSAPHWTLRPGHNGAGPADAPAPAPPGSDGTGQGEPVLLYSQGLAYSPELEAYRRLRTNLLAIKERHHLQVLAVTSADRGEGKSTIVANLALALARSGRRTLVIDADLRLPSIHRLFHLSNHLGLSDALRGRVDLHEATQDDGLPGLSVLTSGPLVDNPPELLESARMRELLARAAEEFEFVLVDTPCLLSTTDAAVLAPLASGVAVVVSRGQTRREDLRAVLGQLADVRAEVVGLIVNRAERERAYYYGDKLRRGSTPVDTAAPPDEEPEQQKEE